MPFKLKRLPGGGQHPIPLNVMILAIAESLGKGGSEEALSKAYKAIGVKKETGDPKRVIASWRSRVNKLLMADDAEAMKHAKAAGLEIVNETKLKR